MPDAVLVRRADAGFVIFKALRAAAIGLGTRKIARWLMRAQSTVRGWLSAAKCNSGALVALLSAQLAVTDPLTSLIHCGNLFVGVIDLLGRLLAAVTRRHKLGKLAVWELFCLVTVGMGLAPLPKLQFATRVRV